MLCSSKDHLALFFSVRPNVGGALGPRLGILPSIIVLGMAAAAVRLGPFTSLSFLFAAIALGMVCGVDHFIKGGCFFLHFLLNDQDSLSFLLLILTLPFGRFGSFIGTVRLVW